MDDPVVVQKLLPSRVGTAAARRVGRREERRGGGSERLSTIFSCSIEVKTKRTLLVRRHSPLAYLVSAG